MKGRPTKRRRPAFGTRLAAIRNERGMTQDVLAKKLNVNRSIIRYYERDTNDPKVSFVLRCAAALGVPIDQLIGANAIPDTDPVVSRFARTLMRLEPKQRAFALRLFSTQLPALRRRTKRL